MILEDIQGFVSRNRVYKVIIEGRHCKESKKEEERSRFEVDNLKLPNL